MDLSDARVGASECSSALECGYCWGRRSGHQHSIMTAFAGYVHLSLA